MVSNLSFVHVWRRTYFLHQKLGVPTADFVKAAAPLVEAHPYRQFLATYTDDPRTKRLAWEKMTIPEPDDLEYQEASMWLEYQTRHLPAAAGMRLTVSGPTGPTPRDCYTLANNSPGHGSRLVERRCCCAAVLFRRSARPSPSNSAVTTTSRTSRSGRRRRPSILAVAMAFARRAKAAGRWEEAEKWLKLVTASGDADAFQQLAKVYESQGKWDLWVATLEDSLKGPDFGLWHAMVHTSMARYYMHGKQWEKALPHAKEAAESYSAWGLQVLAECARRCTIGRKRRRSTRPSAERYPNCGGVLVRFLPPHRPWRSGRGPPQVRRGRRPAAESLPAGRPWSTTCWRRTRAKCRLSCESFARDGNPVCNLHLAVLADQAHDKCHARQNPRSRQAKGRAVPAEEEPAKLCELRRPGRT